jgi:flagellar hook-associated protein 3 FlgL
MISSLNAAGQTFVDNLNRIDARMQNAQQELSTGLKIVNVSDDPDAVSEVLQTRADLDYATQIQTNLGETKTEVDAGEQALESAVQLVENARTLGSQAITGTADADTRTDIANQIGSILEELGGLAGTTVDGRYIFSGDSDQTAPYTIDLTQADPISAYAGSAATRQAQHPNGTTFAISETAQQIFDAPDSSDNVFYSVNDLRVALLNNDQTGIDTALQNVITADTYLNQQLAFYGSVQDKVADATTYANNQVVSLNTQLSSLQDADMTQAITEFTQSQTEMQAALESRAKIPTSTLFDYLG